MKIDNLYNLKRRPWQLPLPDRGYYVYTNEASTLTTPKGVQYWSNTINARLITRLTKGIVATPSLDFRNRYMSIHTKMSTIGQSVT